MLIFKFKCLYDYLGKKNEGEKICDEIFMLIWNDGVGKRGAY